MNFLHYDRDTLTIEGGLVVAHTHLYSALARGMPAPERTPTNFTEILERVWWRLDRALDASSIAMSARVGIAEAVSTGATCLIDHHESPNCIEGSLDLIADAFEQAGVRGVVCYGITARNGGEAEWRAGLEENARFLRTNTRRLVRGMVGIHACFTVPDEALRESAQLARAHGVGLHVHVAEDAVDADAFERLASVDAVVPGSIFAHGVHAKPEHVAAACEAGVWWVQNARSNLNNAVGFARLEAGEPHVGLGTDGFDGDMLSEAHVLACKASEAKAPVSALARLEQNVRLVEAIFGAPIDDRVRLDYVAPTPLHAGNVGGHLLFGKPRVRDIVVEGRFVARPDPALRADAPTIAAELWRRMAALS